MDWLVELIFELLLNGFAEVIADIIGHLLTKNSSSVYKENKPGVFWPAISYAILGAITGFISVIILPHAFIANGNAKILSLIFSPLLAGLMMHLIKLHRQKSGKRIIRFETFFYAYIFAFAISLIRFFWTTQI